MLIDAVVVVDDKNYQVFPHGDIDVVLHAQSEISLNITSGERYSEEFVAIVTLTVAAANDLIRALEDAIIQR